MKNAVTLSGIIARHVNKARGKAIDKAPVELKPVFYRGEGSSLMADMPRRPATRIKEYLTIRRLARDYEVQGLSELSHPAFEVLELQIDRVKRSKWVTVESPSASSLVPDFSGDTGIQIAPKERTEVKSLTSGQVQLSLDLVPSPRLMFTGNWQWPKVSMTLPEVCKALTGKQMRLPC
jgi:hypothetical protein